jgi:hypothetical protein
MDIATKKLRLVQEFLQLNDEELIDKLNQFLKSERKRLTRKKIKPLTEKELNRRIDKAEADSSNSRLVSVHDLKSEINSWK